MKEYISLVKHVLENGTLSTNRTNEDTLECFGYHYKIFVGKKIPLLTTKEMNYQAVFDEVEWYLSGDNHIRNLRGKTKIWDNWADKDGNLETSYARFWRKFPLPIKPIDTYDGEAFCDRMTPWVSRDKNTCAFVVDQIKYIVDILKEARVNPSVEQKRRLVLTAWHPGNATVSKLPPCHLMAIFNIDESKNELNCHLTQRSGDIGLGVPFNMAAYSLLLRLIANQTGYNTGWFSHLIVNAHIYMNHVEALKEQIKRTPKSMPTLYIKKGVTVDNFKGSDAKIFGYSPYAKVKMKVSV